MAEHNKISRFRGCLLGLACGDAVGAPFEFKMRGGFPKVTDMVGGGIFGLIPGQWTDDTSMALCLASSLVEQRDFDPLDQMNRYVRWRDEGYFSSVGTCFGIGGNTWDALARFDKSNDPFSGSEDPMTAGNGCIMRLAPIPMFFHQDLEAAIYYAGESARTTHAARECIDASRLFGGMIARALAGKSKDDILSDHHDIDGGIDSLAPAIRDIAACAYRDKTEGQILGSGYVVESLEAALWCFVNTDNFEEAVLRAVNLGEDADTTAAICGQLAGAYYGEEGIPSKWLEQLRMRTEITQLAERLYELSLR